LFPLLHNGFYVKIYLKLFGDKKNKKAQPSLADLFDAISLLFQVYFRQLSATGAVLNSDRNDGQSVIAIPL
jgi:hypothetical protein